MSNTESAYGLRARTLNRRRNAGKLSREEVRQPAAKATIGAGLRPGALAKAERLLFSSCSKLYLEFRYAWHITSFLSWHIPAACINIVGVFSPILSNLVPMPW